MFYVNSAKDDRFTTFSLHLWNSLQSRWFRWRHKSAIDVWRRTCDRTWYDTCHGVASDCLVTLKGGRFMSIVCVAMQYVQLHWPARTAYVRRKNRDKIRKKIIRLALLPHPQTIIGMPSHRWYLWYILKIFTGVCVMK